MTLPVAFHTGTFPFQFNAHGGDGERVLAPLTDYHDLRAIVAAERGLSVDEAVAWWPAPAASTVRELLAASTAELAQREAGLDVRIAAAVTAPAAMFTITHPTNRVLLEMARQVLTVLELPAEVSTGAREFLGARRAPVEAAVVAALGFPGSAVREHWQIDNADIPLTTVLEAHLRLYAARPDVVADARVRHAHRLDALGL